MITPPDPEWLRRRTETDPDIDCEASTLKASMTEPVEPCPTCPEGWRPLDKGHCADCYEGQIERLNTRIEALEADIADRESLLLAAGKRLAECDAAMVAAHTLLKRFEAALRHCLDELEDSHGFNRLRAVISAALAPESK